MESSLCLSYGHPSTMPLALPFPAANASSRATKLYFSLINSPQSLSCHTKQRLPGRHVIKPAIHASGGSRTPSTNDKGDNKIAKATVGAASLVLACALGIMGWNCRMIPKAIAGPRIMFQKAPVHTPMEGPSLMSGKGALQSLFDVSEKLASTAKIPERKIRVPVSPGPSIADVREIYKVEAVRLMKSGEPNKAVKMLQDIVDTCNKQEETESAYFAEMALVEILICQGKYKEALKCKCLDESPNKPHDVRRHLYKAILHTMLDEEEDAAKFWDEFVDVVRSGSDLPNPFN